MKQQEPSYRAFVQQEFNRRCRKNPAYSLRAFARDLGMPAPKLSQMLRGICGISGKKASQIAQKVNWVGEEAELFISLVESVHSRSKTRRGLAQEVAQRLSESQGFSELDLERFQIIRDWYYFAILELTELKEFRSDPKWIAKRLGISAQETELGIQKLLHFGLLRETEKGYVQTKVDLATPSGIPSRDLKEHHSQILRKADEALDSVSVEERDISEVTMAIDANQMDEARKWLKEFRRRFCKDVQSQPDKNRVYCLAIQFFPLDLKQEKL